MSKVKTLFEGDVSLENKNGSEEKIMDTGWEEGIA